MKHLRVELKKDLITTAIYVEPNFLPGDATKPSNIKRTISTISEESKDVEKASEKAEKKTEDDETGKMIDEEKSETGRVWERKIPLENTDVR